MSIHDRLTLLFTVIIIIVFSLFATMVSRQPTRLIGEIDKDLQAIAQASVEEARQAGRQDLTSLNLPDDLDPYEAATTFFIVTNTYGNVITQSLTLADSAALLDPQGLDFNPVNPQTRLSTIGSLRVLTVPILTETADGVRLSGYLQVARRINDYDAYRTLNRVVLLTGAAALTLGLFLIILLTPSFLRPLEEITQVAEQITSAEDLSRRIPDEGRDDEIGRLTRAINRLMQRLENLFRSQQRLLADVSHELRTPLTAIRGNLDLLRMMGSADRESLDAIETEVKRMTRLVEDLLTLARADGGGLTILQEAVDLDTVFLDVYRQITMLKRPVRLEIGAIDQACVLGDADRLKQLMLILLDNATKYTPTGGTVTMELAIDDTHAILAVNDTGIGIARQDLRHIFERFYRVDKARTRGTGGSGLGLSIAQSIVTAHGGTIEVDSELGHGTKFTVRLPLYRGAPSGYGTPAATRSLTTADRV